ncbi:MAG: CPBP family intramembrane metalloprotease [Rhodobacteraceae bacterium]|nr:CPBP family intramembrane metalloprotease [Paracoccaceae bacterium]
MALWQGDEARHDPVARSRAVEFAALYLVTPLVVAVALPPSAMFPMLFAVTALGLVLLARTRGFRARDLLRGGIDWRVVAGLAAITAAASAAVMLLVQPAAFLALPRENPGLMLMIVALYPIFSALPQELLFRPLFFRRYGALMPDTRTAIAVNAAVFSLAHLMYWNLVAMVMTFVGGLVFGWAYEVRRSFPLALLLHSVAGWILFAAGLGIFFYSGNIERPF